MSESIIADMPVKILLIDDDKEEFILMKKQVAKIKHGSFALDWASNFEAGVESLLANQYDACFVDYFLDHQKNGIDLIREAVSGGCNAPLILLTGQSSFDLDMEAMKSGASDFIVKSKLDPEILERSIRYAVERKRSFNAAKESEARYHQLAEHIPGVVFQMRLHAGDGRITAPYLNQVGLEFLGYDKAKWQRVEADASLALEIMHEDDRENFQRALSESKNTGDPVMWEGRIRNREGDWRWFHGTCHCRMLPDGDALWECAFLDVTARKHAEYEVNKLNVELENRVAQRTEELRESEERYRNLVEGSIQGIIIHREGTPLFANRAFARIFGYDSPEEVVSTGSIESMIAPHEIERIRKYNEARIRGEDAPTNYQFQGVKKDGTLIWLDNFASVINWQGRPALTAALIDITEKKLAEQRMRQAQRMESIGSMAAGIAHNINNILTPIVGYTKMAIQKLDPQSEIFSELQVVRKAADRAKALVNQILVFSRQIEGEPKSVNLGPVTAEAAKLMESSLSTSIHVSARIAPVLPRVLADPAQLSSVLMNLCINARDAMPDGGQLGITLDWTEVEQYALYSGEIINGSFVKMSVSDTGNGIDSELISRIFEPFYTTKEVGKGTGLGLSTVYGIVRDHDGFIDVTSEIDVGTTFDIYLPVLAEEIVEDGEAAKLAREHCRVLVVSTDSNFGDTATATLCNLAKQVDVVSRGADAATVLQENPDKYKLLILDQDNEAAAGAQLIKMLHLISDNLVIVAVGSEAARGDSADIGADAFVSNATFQSHARDIVLALAAPNGRESQIEPMLPGEETLRNAMELTAEVADELSSADQASARFEIKQEDGATIVHVSGTNPLDHLEIGELLRVYTVAEQNKKETKIVCDASIYNHLSQIGFDKFLKLAKSA